MKASRFTLEQIVAILHEAAVGAQVRRDGALKCASALGTPHLSPV
jgi:hypothetical protein